MFDRIPCHKHFNCRSYCNPQLVHCLGLHASVHWNSMRGKRLLDSNKTWHLAQLLTRSRIKSSLTGFKAQSISFWFFCRLQLANGTERPSINEVRRASFASFMALSSWTVLSNLCSETKSSQVVCCCLLTRSYVSFLLIASWLRSFASMASLIILLI